MRTFDVVGVYPQDSGVIFCIDCAAQSTGNDDKPLATWDDEAGEWTFPDDVMPLYYGDECEHAHTCAHYDETPSMCDGCYKYLVADVWDEIMEEQRLAQWEEDRKALLARLRTDWGETERHALAVWTSGQSTVALMAKCGKYERLVRLIGEQLEYDYIAEWHKQA